MSVVGWYFFWFQKDVLLVEDDDQLVACRRNFPKLRVEIALTDILQESGERLFAFVDAARASRHATSVTLDFLGIRAGIVRKMTRA
ncbi:hypothetical protein ACEPUD_19875 [Burkholderia ubonensis]|uniref:hypothetical protein n=1 Tax=Burkholderia ubonensis TaxID=101571 RepID=UPI00358E7431